MSGYSDSQTSLTLMDMLRQYPKNADAWDRFVRLYRPKIYGWCRTWGLQEADAEDVAQDVITKLTEKMSNFQYDRSRCFRAWLKTITQHALSDLVASRHRAVGSLSTPMWETIEARADLERQIEEILQPRVARAGDLQSPGEGRGPNLACLPLDRLRRALGCGSIAVAPHPGRVGLRGQASRSEDAQGRNRQA